jgi:hypothetical protein
MHEIWKLQDELFIWELINIKYVTSNPKPLFTSRVELEGIEKKLSISAHARQVERYRLGAPPPLPNPKWPREAFIKKLKIVRVSIDETFTAQEQRLSKKDLLPFFKKTIDSTTLFYFRYNDTISFERYIELYGSYRQALFELRKEEAHVKRINSWGPYYGLYGNEVTEDVYEEDQERVRAKYPARYVENYEFDYSNHLYDELNLLNWYGEGKK